MRNCIQHIHSLPNPMIVGLLNIQLTDHPSSQTLQSKIYGFIGFQICIQILTAFNKRMLNLRNNKISIHFAKPHLVFIMTTCLKPREISFFKVGCSPLVRSRSRGHPLPNTSEKVKKECERKTWLQELKVRPTTYFSIATPKKVFWYYIKIRYY